MGCGGGLMGAGFWSGLVPSSTTNLWHQNFPIKRRNQNYRQIPTNIDKKKSTQHQPCCLHVRIKDKKMSASFIDSEFGMKNSAFAVVVSRVGLPNKELKEND